MAEYGLKQLLAEARAAVEEITPAEAKVLLDGAGVLFVDVREAEEIREQGAIKGAVHVPRGLIEFHADPESSKYLGVLHEARRVVVYCSSGARSCLACKTLKDLGVENVVNLDGGFMAWRLAGGAACMPEQ